jgi:hypothetical protein
MSQSFPNGTVFSVSTALATAIPLTAISNASPPVASTSTPPTVGTYGVIESPWSGLNNRVSRVATVVAATSFTLEGFDTTNTTQYPAATDTGTFQSVSSWVQLSQVTNIAKSGGTQQYFSWQYAEDPHNTQIQRPTFKNARTLTLTLDYDPALAWYAALEAADQAQVPVVLKAQLPSGAILLYYVYPAFDGDPSMNLNKNMDNTATFSQIAPLTRYTS